jgi:hypothetical protein
LLTGHAVPDHGVFRLLGEHCGENFDFRLDHQFVHFKLAITVNSCPARRYFAAKGEADA